METKLSFGFLYALNVPYVKSKKCLGYLVLIFISTVIGSSHCFNSSNIRFHFLPTSGPERESAKKSKIIVSIRPYVLFFIITFNFLRIYELSSLHTSSPSNQPIGTSKFFSPVFSIQGACSWNTNVLRVFMIIKISSFEKNTNFFRESVALLIILTEIEW